MYWKTKEKADAKMLLPEKYPVVVINTEDGIGFYSLPSVDYPGAIKVP